MQFLNNWQPLIKASRRWTLTMKINTNTKLAKCLQMTERTDVQTYVTATQGIWTFGMWPHALRSIIGHAFMVAKKRRGLPEIDIKKKSEIKTNRNTYKLNWTPLGSSGPQCGDTYIAMLDPQTGNEYKYKNCKRPADNQTDIWKNILNCRSGDFNQWHTVACAAQALWSE